MPTPWDMRRIAKMTGEDPFDFIEFLEPDELEDMDDDDPTWLKVNGKRYIMALERDEEKGCYFLDQKTKFCKIYDARPILCRLFPFELHETEDGGFKKFTLHKDVDCPKNTDGEYAVGPLWDLAVQDDLNQDDYHELVEFFNKQEYEGKEIEDFVLLFVNGYSEFNPPFETEDDD